jgi:D-alanyl-D-alanine carboxypeptidase
MALAAEQPKVAAQYAVVVDAGSGEVLYDKGMNTPTAPASLTKVFTAVAALDAASVDRNVPIDQYDLVGEASMGLQTGQNVSLRTLLHGLLMVSGNDAAMAIARNVGALAGDSPQQSINRFMTRLNSLGERLGLTGTHFLNPHGLDHAGHQSTARDIAAITMYALKNNDFRQIISTPYYHEEGFELYQANMLLEHYPGLIGGKTGYTDNAGYCLLEVAQRDGHTIIAVLLKSTKEAWYQDATTLLDYGFATVATHTDAPIQTIILSPAPVTAHAAASESAVSTSSGLKIQRVDSTTAIVHSASTATVSGSRFSWTWPLAALTAMIIVLGLTLNFHTLIGIVSLLWHSRRYFKVPARQPSTPAMFPMAATGPASAIPSADGQSLRYSTRPYITNGRPAATRPVPRFRLEPAERPGFARTNGARSTAEPAACKAIRLSLRGQYQEATREFVRALRSDPGLDLTRCAGFWKMGPAGLAAAVHGYRINDREEDARALMTILQLSIGSDRELDRLLSHGSMLSR